MGEARWVCHGDSEAFADHSRKVWKGLNFFLHGKLGFCVSSELFIEALIPNRISNPPVERLR